MATRMQQRRGTAAQWTSANPTLAAGEIGFETDTNKFKVGNGSSAWSSLTYFVDGSVAFDETEVANLIDAAVADLVGGAPDALNTIWELSNAINGDANFAWTVTTNIGGLNNSISLVESEVAGIQNAIVDLGYAIGNTTADLGDLTSNTASSISDAIDTAAEYTTNSISTHNSDTTDVHGIANTAVLATQSDVATAKSEAITDAGNEADSKISTAVSALTKSSVGLSNVDNTSDSDKPVSTATQTALDLKSNLDGPTFTGNVALPSTTTVGNVSSTELGYLEGLTSNVQAQIDAKASLSGANFTGSVEIDQNLTVDGNFIVNGSNVLVSATQIQIEDTLLQLGHENSGNTTDLGIVVSYNDGAQKHAGLVKDITDGKWKLFDGVTTEPATTVDFTQGSLDNLVVNGLEATTLDVGNVSNTEIGYLNGTTSNIQDQINSKAPIESPTFTGLVSLAANGIAFTDGTQTKEGVPSRTPIIQKTESYTLSNLIERDNLVEMGSSSTMTLTIPADSTLNFPVGTSMDILQTSTGQVTIAGAAGVTVNATPGLKLRTQWSSATLFKRSADTWVVYGDLMA
jgi:hypothetical protein